MLPCLQHQKTGNNLNVHHDETVKWIMANLYHGYRTLCVIKKNELVHMWWNRGTLRISRNKHFCHSSKSPTWLVCVFACITTSVSVCVCVRTCTHVCVISRWIKVWEDHTNTPNVNTVTWGGRWNRMSTFSLHMFMLFVLWQKVWTAFTAWKKSIN